MKPARLFAAGLGMVFLLTGCFVTKQGPRFDARDPRNISALTNLASIETTNQIRQEWLQPSSDFYRLGPGDRLEIEVTGEPETRATTVVAPDGRVYYYLLPGVDVWGLSLPEAADRLEQALAEFYTDPKEVMLQLREIASARVWVLGRVAKPGLYTMAAPMTLLEAVTTAGGTLTSEETGTTEDMADLSQSFVIRNGERLPIDFEGLFKEGDMSQNIYLQPDDFVYIPSALSRDIYVLGAVRMPKAVARQHRTLAAAIADAGGPVPEAYLSHVGIVRGSMSDPKIAVVDYDEIVKGKAPDVILEPRDIIYVPYSPYRFLSRYWDLIMTTFVRAVAINEGARAASDEAGTAGVSIPIGVGLGGAVVPVVPGR